LFEFLALYTVRKADKLSGTIPLFESFMETFSKLFKKYRLRAEFESLADFADSLAKKGIFYEESIFSRWQNGTRIPTDRNILLQIIKIFIERNALTTIQEANDFLASCKQKPLTSIELKTLPESLRKHTVFQVPAQITDFAGREDIISHLFKNPPMEKYCCFTDLQALGKQHWQ